MYKGRMDGLFSSFLRMALLKIGANPEKGCDCMEILYAALLMFAATGYIIVVAKQAKK